MLRSTSNQRAMRLAKATSRRGFSLIETLMVVSIIAIIATVAIPLLLNARRATLDEKARGCLRALATAQQNYFAAEGRFGSLEDLTSSEPPFLDQRFAAAESEGLGQGIAVKLETDQRGLSFSAAVLNPGGNFDFGTDESFEIRSL